MQAGEGQRVQQIPPGYYQGYPPYPYGPYAPPQQKTGGGIPAYVWIAVGLGIAFVVNKVTTHSFAFCPVFVSVVASTSQSHRDQAR